MNHKITAYLRGHKIYYDWDALTWRYTDNNQLIKENERYCVRCGQMPTIDGHDACIANLVGVANACCGHGVEKGYVQVSQFGESVELGQNF